MIKTEIIIIGGGVAGSLCAILLAQQGINVTLVEQNELTLPKTPLPPHGRSVALMHPDVTLLQEAGIWERLQKEICPLETMRIIEGKVKTSFHAHEINLHEFGFNVPNNALRIALIKRLNELPNLTLKDKTELWDIQLSDTGITALLSDDCEIEAQLIIGADGKNSKVRHIVNIDAIKTNYKQTALTCLIKHSLSHNNTSNEFHKPGGPFTTVPCPDQTSTIVWCENEETAQEYLLFKKPDIENKIQELSQNILGDIQLESSLESYKLSGLVARKFTAHRVALIAEAAHVLHPIGAQGLNLSLRDIHNLYTLVSRQKQLGLDLGSLSLLKEYKASRKHDTFSRFAGVTGFNNITSIDSKAFQMIRQAGYKAIGNTPYIKQKLMKLGLGNIRKSYP